MGRSLPEDVHAVAPLESTRLGPPGDDIKELIKIHPWGTHLLVTEGGNAYWTHAGDNPGAMEAIWDYDKYPGRYQLKPRSCFAKKVLFSKDGRPLLFMYCNLGEVWPCLVLAWKLLHQDDRQTSLVSEYCGAPLAKDLQNGVEERDD